MSKIKGISSPTLERLRALDPGDPGSAAVVVDAVIAIDEGNLSAEEANAIYAEINRITRVINKRHAAKR